MRGEIIDVGDLTAAEMAAWSELAEGAVSPNPFMEPDFVLPAMRGLRVRDVGLLVVRGRDEWRLAVPVRRQWAWHGIPGRCLAAWRHNYCFLSTPLIAGEDPEAAVAAMAERAAREAPSFVIDPLDADGPLAEPLSAAMGARARLVTLREFDRAVLRRDQAGAVEISMSTRHRSNHRRARRRLEEQLGPVATRDRAGDIAAYQQFLALESSGWKGTAGTALACHPGHVQFFHEMCHAFARRGRLQLWSLGTDEQTVAMMCNVVAGDGTFGFKMAYDQAYARYEPGIQLILDVIDRFAESPSLWFDSCAESDNETLSRMWQGHRRLSSTVAVRPGDAAAEMTHLKWRAAAEGVPVRARMRRRWAWARRLERFGV